jgi:hypothetical protein
MKHLFMLSKDSVCKPDCPERTPTCHATCKEYKIEAHKRRLKLQKIRQARDLENGLLEAEIIRHTRNKWL